LRRLDPKGGFHMTNRERENATLSFTKPNDRGVLEETFFPWTLTVERFAKEGLPLAITKGILDIVNDSSIQKDGVEKYLNVAWGEGVFNYEKYLGFDPVRRVGFTLPFRRFEEKIIEDAPGFVIKSDWAGKQLKFYKQSGLVEVYKQVVTCEDDWKKLKEYGDRELAEYFTDENITNAYSPLRHGYSCC